MNTTIKNGELVKKSTQLHREEMLNKMNNEEKLQVLRSLEKLIQITRLPHSKLVIEFCEDYNKEKQEWEKERKFDRYSFVYDVCERWESSNTYMRFSDCIDGLLFELSKNESEFWWKNYKKYDGIL